MSNEIGKRLANMTNDLHALASWALDHGEKVSVRTLGGNSPHGPVVKIGKDFLIIGPRSPAEVEPGRTNWEGYVVPFSAIDSIRIRFPQD